MPMSRPQLTQSRTGVPGKVGEHRWHGKSSRVRSACETYTDFAHRHLRWAQQFGNRDDLADIFFTLKQTKFNGETLPGLGFNIVRYNAGACSWNSVDGEKMVVSPNVKRSRQMEGYWLDWKSSDPASSSWNWYDTYPDVP